MTATIEILACGDMRGENTGYRRHLKIGQDACAECLRAHAVYVADWRADHTPEQWAEHLERRRRQHALRREAAGFVVRPRPARRTAVAR